MTKQEKYDYALPALAARIERARKNGDRKELAEMREWYREVAAIICEDEEFPPTQIPI